MHLIRSILDLLFPEPNRRSRVDALPSENLRTLFEPVVISTEAGTIHALFPYQHLLVKDLIWALKYEGNQHALELVATMLRDVLLEEISNLKTFNTHPVLIIPVPLGPNRHRERGYNQAAWIAERTANLLGEATEYCDALVRIRDTPPQTSLSRAERLKNVLGAFKIGNKGVNGRSCLLIDDVVTTGSTLGEASRVLTDAGATHVECVAVSYSRTP